MYDSSGCNKPQFLSLHYQKSKIGQKLALKWTKNRLNVHISDVELQDTVKLETPHHDITDLKVLSNNTIAVCSKIRLREYSLLLFNIEGKLLFTKDLQGEVCGITEVMCKGISCLAIATE